MKKLYRETFGEVHPSKELREDILHMRGQSIPRRRRLPAAGLVAAVLVAALATSTIAIAVSPTLRDWFNKKWGEATGGSMEEMMISLARLAELPGDYRVLPGHMEPSTLERERRYNPYIRMALQNRRG